MTTAAIYTRISRDRSGKRAGVERQRIDCEARVAREGWSVVGYYEDDDVSAYSGRERPAYERLQAGVARGEIDVVVAWHSDRLWRSVIEQQTLLAIGRDAGLKLVATMSGDFDPADADDAFMSTLLTAVAQKESADKSRRISRKMQELAKHGKLRGGPRPFGLTADRAKLATREAKAARDAARRVLAGESLGAVTRDLNRRGIATSTGDVWTADRLRKTLARPSLAGLAEYRGDVVGPAEWPAVIDVETHERLVALFASWTLGPRKAPARKYLLASGITRCGNCGARLRAMNRTTGARYVCRSTAHGGCGGVSIYVDRTDDEVARQVFDYVQTPAFGREVRRARNAATDAGSEIAKASDELTRDRARLNELGDAYADGDMDRAQYRRQVGRLETRIAANEAKLAHTGDDSALLVIDRDALRAGWPTMTLDERRTVLEAIVETITVAPVRMAHVPAADRIKIDWRG